jgi:hypothetical protein
VDNRSIDGYWREVEIDRVKSAVDEIGAQSEYGQTVSHSEEVRFDQSQLGQGNRRFGNMETKPIISEILADGPNEVDKARRIRNQGKEPSSYPGCWMTVKMDMEVLE